MRIMAIAAGLAVLAVAGCGGGPMTIEEYSAAFCDLDRPADFETWGESLGPSREALAGLKDLSPPPVAQDYHEAVVAGTEAVIEFIESQDPDDAFDLRRYYFLARSSAAFTAQTMEAMDALPAETREMLEDCLA